MLTLLFTMVMFMKVPEPVASFVPLSSTLKLGSRNTCNIKSKVAKLSNSKIPFIVEQIGKESQPSKSDANEISSIVISVFFQEEAERLPEKRSKGSITKSLILAYLKNLQYGDVRGKKFILGNGVNNSMFVARRLVPCLVDDTTTYSNDSIEIDTAMSGYTLEDLMERCSVGKMKGKIYNRDHLPASSGGYRFGDILGFVDVTEKIFGLPSDIDQTIGNDATFLFKSSLENSESSSIQNLRVVNGDRAFFTRKNIQSLRPVLTNLSVKPEARCSGVGTALVDVCEDVVMDSMEWSRIYSEMVLEVEEENVLAQKFYEKKGYIALFADPSSRRYDTSGLLLSNVRTTKICYRKDLTQKRASSASKDVYSGVADGSSIGVWFRKVKQVLGIVQ